MICTSVLETNTETIYTESLEQEKGEVPFNLEGCAHGFGIDIARVTLSEYQVWSLYLSQKLEKYIKDLKIPVSVEQIPSNKTQLVEKEVEKTVERATYKESQRPSLIPADQVEIGRMRRLEELPDVLSKQWLAEELTPELFYQRLAERKLLKRDWLEKFRERQVSYETVKDKELVEVQAPPVTKTKQHAYVLIDTSSSMTEFEDGRDLLAKGLALAFLKQGNEQGSQLGVRPFSGAPHQLMEGKDQAAFFKIARTILDLSMEQGGTDINLALQTAVSDICRRGNFARADILLITDGYDVLGQNPLGDINLHTFILGESAYDQNLKLWSKSFKRIRLSPLPKGLSPTEADIKDLEKGLGRLHEQTKTISNWQEADVLANQAEALKNLLQVYRQTADPELLTQALESEEKIEKSLSSSALRKIIEANKRKAEEALREKKEKEEAYARQQAEEKRRIEQILSDQVQKYQQYRQQRGQEPMEHEELPPEEQESSFWELVKKTVHRLWNQIRKPKVVK